MSEKNTTNLIICWQLVYNAFFIIRELGFLLPLHLSAPPHQSGLLLRLLWNWLRFCFLQASLTPQYKNEGVSKFRFSALRAEIQQIIINQTLFNLLVSSKLIICWFWKNLNNFSRIAWLLYFDTAPFFNVVLSPCHPLPLRTHVHY